MQNRRSNGPRHRASVILVDKGTFRVAKTRVIFDDNSEVIREAIRGIQRNSGSTQQLVAVSPTSLDPRSLGRGRTTPTLLSHIRQANPGSFSPQEPRSVGNKVSLT